MGLITTFKLGWGQWLQGKRAYGSKGAYEREMHARAAEKRGDYEQANLYRMCLCASEWHELGYEGSFGNYKKVSAPKTSLYEATNGAYGAEDGMAERVEHLEMRRSLRGDSGVTQDEKDELEYLRGRLKQDG